MKVEQLLKEYFEAHNITLYAAAKRINMKYELVRRTFNEKSCKLSADEFVTILEAYNIDYYELINGKKE